jgi:hypothetical protein
MAQRLIKNTNFTYRPASPGTAGFAGQAYQPSRVAVQPVQVCSYFELTGAELAAAYAAQGVTLTYGVIGTDFQGTPVYGYIPTFPPGGSYNFSVTTRGYRCTTQFQQVIIPAQPYIAPIPPSPAIPEQITYDYQLGWNARANSISRMALDGRYTFTIPQTVVGVVAGLTREPKTSGYADILWGFYVTRDNVRIYERGVEVANLGSNADATLSIERRTGRVIYKVDGSVVRETTNTSGPLMLSAALYSGGDSVDDAEYEDLNDGVGSGSFSALQAFGNEAGVAYAIGAGSLQALTSAALADATGVGSGSFGVLQAFASDASGYAIGVGVLVPLYAAGEGLAPPPAYALGGGFILGLQSASFGYTGTVGSGSGSFKRLEVIGAEDTYAQGSGSFNSLASLGENYTPADEVLMLNTMIAFQDAVGETTLFVVLDNNMGVAGVFTIETILEALMEESLGVGSAYVTEQELLALIMSTMSARGIASDEALDYTVWALNTEAMGSTRYENYAFNSMAKVGTRYYGANSSGLYLLEGSSDNGEDIVSRINLGKQNFGSLLRKALPFMYMGVASNGHLVLKVEADGQTFYYTTEDQGQGLKAQRFKLGRGLRASFYQMTLENYGGTHFEISDIEFTPIELNRRL